MSERRYFNYIILLQCHSRRCMRPPYSAVACLVDKTCSETRTNTRTDVAILGDS